jgi:arylsulfatase A-like enzyme
MTYVSASGLPNRVKPAEMKMSPPAPVTALAEEEITYAEVLQQAGYATAHFGKWHLGKADPTSHGYDESDGANSNRPPSGDSKDNQAEYLATAEKGIDFMQRQVEAGQPFLLQVDHYPIMDDRSSDARLAEVALAMDASFGQLYDALEELGVADNTYVIYTTDHGTHGELNTPLSNGKGSVLEGGLRVPFIVSGPGVRAAQWANVPVTALDIFPTIAELSGNTDAISADVEGGSLAAVLQDKHSSVQRSREEIVFHFPHYDLDNAGPATAILLGDYKLVKNYEAVETLLFNLLEDPGESKDLSTAMPKLVAELDKKLVAYLEAIDAQMAEFNPDYAN